ncbi:MAG: hypothetical protein WC859_09410 [Elusimicrobiota bacterium]|jgi:biotin transporter BioY
MSLDHRILYGFVSIALLTGVLAATNTHRAVVEFLTDKVTARLLFFLGFILLMGYLILHTAYRLFDHVLTASQMVILE